MKKYAATLLLAAASVLSLAAPAAAAPATVQVSCPGNDSYSGYGTTGEVSWGSDCRSNNFGAYLNRPRRYGHWELYVDNYRVNSGTQWWEHNQRFSVNTGITVRDGQLWCNRFWDADGSLYAGNCVTI